MHRHVAIAHLVVASVLAACSTKESGETKGDGGGDASGSASGIDDNEDVLEPTNAVPMALIDGRFLATIGNDAAVGGSVAEIQRSTPEADPAASGYEFAKSIFNAGAQATAELRKIYAAAAAVQDAVFGARGFFQGKDVAVRKDGRPRVFDLGAGSPARYVTVSPNPTGAEYAYAIELYAPRPDATLTRTLRLEVSARGTATGRHAAVRLELAQSLPDGAIMRTTARYDTERLEITGTYGREIATPDRPSRTTLRLALGGDEFTVTGAYTWSRSAPVVVGLVPRHQLTQTGDVELFALHGSTTGGQRSAQKLAFVPASVAATVLAPSTSYFRDYAYDREILRFLRTAVRDPGIDGRCAEAGRDVRAALAGNSTVGFDATKIPDDVCATSAFPDADLEAAIDAACRAGGDIVFDVLGDGGAPEPFSVCRRHYEAVLLANPQLFALRDGTPRILEPGDVREPEHDALVVALEAVESIDVTVLSATGWEPLPRKTTAEFAAAEPPP